MSPIHVLQAVAVNLPINEIVGILTIAGIFGFGKKVDDNQPIDREEIVSKLHRGLEDISNADTRTLGMNFMDPDILVTDVQTAYQILQVLDKGERQ